MSESMAERVSRKLCELRDLDPDESCLNDDRPIWQGLMLDHARAVIAAMREPTD